MNGQQPPTLIIQMNANGRPVIKTNLQDPLAVAMWLGLATVEHARVMGQLRESQSKTAIVGPDGILPPIPKEG